MKGLIWFLFAVGFSQLAEECKEKEFKIDGYHTGQNIDLDLDGTNIYLEGEEGEETTFLSLQFLVPQVYVEQHRGAAYSITFNRKTTLTAGAGDNKHKQATEMHIERGDGNGDPACYTNRWTVDSADHATNKTQSLCPQGENTDIWTNLGEYEDQKCLEKMQAKVAWNNVMHEDKKYFGEKRVEDNGRFTEVFLLATVETWTPFTQTTEAHANGDTENYKGQMTGDQEYTGGPDGSTGDTDRTGEYTGDGGNVNGRNQPNGPTGDKWNFPALHMDDERYTLYQIPFILRFPKSVVVEQSFTIGTSVTMLTGLVRQDQIRVNLNPKIKEADDDKNAFTIIEVTVQTVVQYPYAIRGPDDDSDAKMTVITGPDRDDEAQDKAPADETAEFKQNPAKEVRLVEWDDKRSCRNLQQKDQCKQDFRIRITPRDDRPCSVAGQYTMEFWADCVGGIDTRDDLSSESKPDICSLDVLNINSDLAIRRDRNGYFKHTFTVDHTDFCPQVIDTVKVRANIKAYHDQDYSQTSLVADNVFTNDILFYEVTYRTQSDEARGADDIADFKNNDDSAPIGNDDFIDYVRAVKIYATVTIGQDKDGTNAFSDKWVSGANWRDNVDFSLGGNRMPDGDGNDFTEDPSVQLPTNTPATDDYIVYTVLLCEVEDMDTWEIQQTKEKARDCFDLPYEADKVWHKDSTTGENTGENTDDLFAPNTDDEHRDKDSRKKIAVTYFDFNKVTESRSTALETGNQIEENEIAFKLRLDERIIPVSPETDDSHMKVTVEAEVYYHGNRHPTRRRLQNDGPGDLRSQASIQSLSLPVRYKNSMQICHVDENLREATIDLTLKFNNKANLPRPETISDWASDFAFQMETLVKAKKSLQVWSANTDTEHLYNSHKGTRRLEKLGSNEMRIQLNVRSNDENTAGEIANVLQNQFVKGRVPKVKAFENAIVTGMNVPSCSESPIIDFPESSARLASSAVVSSTLIAFLVALVNLL